MQSLLRFFFFDTFFAENKCHRLPWFRVFPLYFVTRFVFAACFFAKAPSITPVSFCRCCPSLLHTRFSNGGEPSLPLCLPGVFHRRVALFFPFFCCCRESVGRLQEEIVFLRKGGPLVWKATGVYRRFSVERWSCEDVRFPKPGSARMDFYQTPSNPHFVPCPL